MNSKIIASTAALAAGCLGIVGVAGAASSSGDAGGRMSRAERIAEIHTIATTGTLPSGFACSTANRQLGRIAAAEQRLPAIEAKLQTAATAAAGTRRAGKAEARLAAAQQVGTDLPIVSKVITSSCPDSSTSSVAAMKVANKIESITALIAAVHSVAATATLPSTFSCTEAAAAQHRLRHAEVRIDARTTTLSTLETAAVNAGRTARAAVISSRITALTSVHADLVTVSNLIATACPA